MRKISKTKRCAVVCMKSSGNKKISFVMFAGSFRGIGNVSLQHEVGALAGNVHLCSLCSNQHFERSVNLCIVGFTFSRSAQGALPQTMAEHPAGAEVAAQLVEHFEPVRGNLTLKLLPGDGECQFRSIACRSKVLGQDAYNAKKQQV